MSDALTSLAGVIVVLSGVFLLGLALLALLAQERAERFLKSFASSPRSHYLEQSLRLLSGLGFVFFAPQMRFQALFQVFGWLLVLTSLALFLVPWRWHQRFGEWAIPLAIAHLRLHALGAFGLGAVVLFAALW